MLSFQVGLVFSLFSVAKTKGPRRAWSFFLLYFYFTSGEKLNCTVCEIYLSHLCAASSLSSRSKRVGDDVGMAAQCEEAEKK
ncbi:MAG TPA: hypothetical protein VGT04_02760, partial [Acidobacteriaceae bacterium]|nr:hypothetical protein [Acidobacteriaceae bacterium]